MSKLKIGDVVRLNSGGPRMTVEDVGDHGYAKNGGTGVRCIWFKGDEKSIGFFEESTLEKFDPKATPLDANRSILDRQKSILDTNR